MLLRSRMLWAYAVAVLFWALCLFGTAQMVRYARTDLSSVILVLALVAMTASFAVWRVAAGPIVVSVGTLVSYLTVALLGPWPAVGVKVVGLAIATGFYAKRGERPRYLAVNGAILGATTLVAGWVYLKVGGRLPPATFTPSLALPFLAMAVTYTAVNVALLAGLRWARSGSSLPRTALDLLARFWVNEGIFALIGLIGLAVYDELHNWGLVAIGGLLLAVRFTFQLYADAHRFRSEMAEVLAQTLTFKDQYTAEHSRRVAENAVRIGRTLGLADRQLERLRDAALLHDIGKLAIPDAVLVKPGPLDAAERERMERHVGAGGELLEQSPYLRELATHIRAHHTEFDAQEGENDIPIEARIIAVADAFDAMTSDRPYRRALPLDEAVRRLQAGAGTQFDPTVVAVLLRLLRPGDDGAPAPAVDVGRGPAAAGEATGCPAAPREAPPRHAG